MSIDVRHLAREGNAAAKVLARTPGKVRNAAVLRIATNLVAMTDLILEANALDVAEATEGGLSAAMVDRLTLNPARLMGMAEDLRRVTDLPDPVGEVMENGTLPNGLRYEKRRVPLGLLAVIYEARPNVTSDTAGLALKSGNAVILRGGKETLRSNRAIVQAIHSGLEETGLPEASVQFVDDPERGLVFDLLQLDDLVQMVIPRGGAGLHDFCRRNSRIPVITGGIGICHLFVAASADLERAVPVIVNAKIQRPTVCNALDTLLVDRSIASVFLPKAAAALVEQGVSLKVDDEALAILQPILAEKVNPAGERDFDTEWLSLVLGIRVVNGIDEAVAHIAAHSSGHSDGIFTESQAEAEAFCAAVDSAAVYVNASTRFTDGSEFGLGAEIAISTQRLHARGPMGLRELMTYKWVLTGNYTARP